MLRCKMKWVKFMKLVGENFSFCHFSICVKYIYTYAYTEVSWERNERVEIACFSLNTQITVKFHLIYLFRMFHWNNPLRICRGDISCSRMILCLCFCHVMWSNFTLLFLEMLEKPLYLFTISFYYIKCNFSSFIILFLEHQSSSSSLSLSHSLRRWQSFT